MKNKYIIRYLMFTVFFPFLSFSQNGGVKIGGSTSNHPSAILQVENFNNKGVLFPQVELLDDLTDTSTPIQNPANGLIVFNKGMAQTRGYYYWDVDTWKLLGDSKNVVRNAVYRNTAAAAYLGGLTTGTYQDVNNSNWFEFSNAITGLSGNSLGEFVIPAGFYIVHINVNFDMNGLLNATAGISNKDVHLMKLKAKLYSGATTIIESADNGLVRGRYYSMNFDLKFYMPSTMSGVKLALAMDTGGTYSNGVGGAGANNGTIRISNISLHFQRTNIFP